MLKKLKVILWLGSSLERDDLKTMLEENAYECLFCENRNELEKLITLHQYSIGLLIIDCNLNSVPVAALCSDLKQKDYLDAYIMILGDISDSDKEVTMYENGADFFIERPVKSQLLITRIDSVLSKKNK